jgi:tetratricopeptide (TPR) repeat protein
MATTFKQLMEDAEEDHSEERYAEALAGFEAALKAAEAPHQRSTALDRMANACYYLRDDTRAFTLLDQAIDAVLPNGDTDPASAIALARAWYDKGGMMAQVGRGPAALAPLDLLIERFADRASAGPVRDHDELRFMVARAMDLKATGLRKQDRARDAVACYGDMIQRFEAVTETPIEAMVARAMRNRAWLLGELGRQDEEIAAHDALVARYGENHLLEVSHIIIDALTSKHQCLRDQEEFEKAAEVCDEITRRYFFDAGEGIAERVARTMIRRGNYFNKLGRLAEELAAYDQVVETYGHFKDPEVRVHVAKSLMFKAVTLNDADQTAAEMECYDEVLRRYAEDPSASVRAVAADALIHKGISLANLAEDAAGDAGGRDIGPEIACFDEVVARYGEDDAVDLMRAVAEALLHKGETLLEAGQTDAGLACLEAVIDGYGAIDDKELRELVKDARALKAEV